MSLYERWHALDKRLAEQDKQIIEKYFNINTYAGNFRNILFLTVGWYVMWHIYDIGVWFENLLDLHYDPPTEAKKSWLRLWISLICGWGISLSIHAITMITIRRFRERKEQSDAKTTAADKPVENDKA